MNSISRLSSLLAVSLILSMPTSMQAKVALPLTDEKNTQANPAHTLERSTDTPPVPAGTPVPQPTTPEGGKDLIKQTHAKVGKPTFALTLAGGGARGGAHIGVLKRLEREGLRPDFIAGSSIGATIGALYASGVPVAEIERMALDNRLKRAYFPIPFQIKSAIYLPQYMLQRIALMKPVPGVFTGKSIARFMRKSLPEGVVNIEDMKIPFAAISVNLMDTKPFWMTKGDIASAIQASNSVPGLYRPVDTGNRLLIDGGLRANLPAEVGKAVGAPIVVGVRLNSMLEAKPKKTFGNLMNYGERITSIFVSEMEAKTMDEAEVVIAPDVEEIPLEGFNNDQIARAIKEGEAAAEKAIPELKEKLRRAQGTAAEPASHI